MIRAVEQEDLQECVNVIRASFLTVANEFGITEENGSRFTAFSTSLERLNWHLNGEHRPMYVYCADGKIIGYYSLLQQANGACELNNLCVHPRYRHRKIGMQLLCHAFERAQALGCSRMEIGIVEENQVLRNWYEKFGFRHTGIKKFDFFPFTCGYMEKEL